MWKHLDLQYPLLLSDFNEILIFLTHFETLHHASCKYISLKAQTLTRLISLIKLRLSKCIKVGTCRLIYFLTDLKKMCKYQILWKIHPLGAELFCTGRHTDGHDEANSHFMQFLWMRLIITVMIFSVINVCINHISMIKTVWKMCKCEGNTDKFYYIFKLSAHIPQDCCPAVAEMITVHWSHRWLLSSGHRGV
jgi:hypothetical protein